MDRQNPYQYECRHKLPSLGTIDDFVAALISGDRDIMHYSLWEARQRPITLLELFERLAVVQGLEAQRKQAFHNLWITQGFHIRDIFTIDPLLPPALPNLLPGYSGSPMELFRGERLSNHTTEAYGPSWSSERSVAKMFASGWNSVSGGVLLRTIAPTSAILVGPMPYGHLRCEAEYIVDRRDLRTLKCLNNIPTFGSRSSPLLSLPCRQPERCVG
jgi:hypothetical protein